MPWQEQRAYEDDEIRTEAKIEIRDEIREWDYGEYEGLRSGEIQEMRKQEGKGEWDIWRDGCPGGEYVLYVLHGKGDEC